MYAPTIDFPTHCLFRLDNPCLPLFGFLGCFMGLLHINNIFSYGLFSSLCNYLFRLMGTQKYKVIFETNGGQ